MRDNEYFLWAIISILLALTGLLLGGGKLMFTIPPSLQETLGFICLLGAFGIGIFLLVTYCRRTIRYHRIRKRGGNDSESLDSQHALGHKDREVSINISINSSDFTDDRMSTKRMDDFHKLVKSISSAGHRYDKQFDTEDISKENKKNSKT